MTPTQARRSKIVRLITRMECERDKVQQAAIDKKETRANTAHFHEAIWHIDQAMQHLASSIKSP